MRVLALVGLLGLVGCAAQPVSELPENVSLSEKQFNGGRNMEAVTFQAPGEIEQPLESCVSLHVSNKSVTLSDSSNSFIGPFSGMYYQNEKSQTVDGGQVVQSSDDNSGAVVASGTTEYEKGGLMPIGYAVRFKLLAAPDEDGLVLQFQDIERAQKDTGNMSNSGFDAVGTWYGAGALDVHQALKGVADDVADCAAGSSLISK